MYFVRKRYGLMLQHKYSFHLVPDLVFYWLMLPIINIIIMSISKCHRKTNGWVESKKYYFFVCLLQRCFTYQLYKFGYKFQCWFCDIFRLGLYGTFVRSKYWRCGYWRTRISICRISCGHCNNARKHILGIDIFHDAAHIGSW